MASIDNGLHHGALYLNHLQPVAKLFEITFRASAVGNSNSSSRGTFRLFWIEVQVEEKLYRGFMGRLGLQFPGTELPRRFAQIVTGSEPLNYVFIWDYWSEEPKSPSLPSLNMHSCFFFQVPSLTSSPELP